MKDVFNRRPKVIVISSFYFANVKHRQQQVTDAIVAGQQGSELH